MGFVGAVVFAIIFVVVGMFRDANTRAEAKAKRDRRLAKLQRRQQQLASPVQSTPPPAETYADFILKMFRPLALEGEAALRLHRRQFREGLRNTTDAELRDMLVFLMHGQEVAAYTTIQAVIKGLYQDVEDEVISRKDETGWDKAKRAARRNTAVAIGWCNSDQGRETLKGAAVVAALLGLGIWTS